MDKQYTTKKISDSTYEITSTIPKDMFTKSYETLLKNEVSKTDVKGFRKGQVPREMVEEKVKPVLLYQVFEKLAPLYVSKAVQEEKLELAATPEFKEVPKLEVKKDITFTVTVTVIPKFTLGNMKKVKVQIKKESVTEKEVEEIIKKLEERKDIKAKKGTKAWVTEVSKFLQFQDIKDMDGLKKKIKEILEMEKENIVRKNAENSALEQAIKLCKIEIPEKAIEQEAHEREHSFMHRLESIKMSIEDYAKSQGLTIEKMREMWMKDSKAAIETDVFLMMFAESKEMKITDEDLEKEIEKIKQSNQVDPQVYGNPQWREYIRKVVLKQRAYEQFLSDVMPKTK